jgi:hypothetical protein
MDLSENKRIFMLVPPKVAIYTDWSLGGMSCIRSSKQGLQGFW